MLSPEKLDEVILMVKTTIVAALLGLCLAVVAPVFGVTEPTPAVVEAEKGWGSGVYNWFGKKKDAGIAVAGAAWGSTFDPEQKVAAMKAANESLLEDIAAVNEGLLREVAALKGLIAKQKVGNMMELDELKSCSVKFAAFLETIEPE